MMKTARKRPGAGMAPKTVKNKKQTAKRLLKYITKSYKKHLTIVFICIILSSIAGVAGSMFLGTLIDDYITPLLLETNPVFTGLLKAILIMALVYLTGVLSTLIYTRIMARISQGVLKEIRDEMFNKMQTFPIKYFDTHTHGEIMSYYTNDVDTLSQMISQSLPQFIASSTTVIAVLIAMIITNIPLTIFVIVFIFLMLNITGRVAGKSGKYFVKQQETLGKVNGYIEEMINGQKVIKVFTYEEEAKAHFDEINDELCKNMTTANKFANILMPMLNNLGNLEYVLVAIIGGAIAIKGNGALTIGSIATFLQLTQNFNQPIMQMSNQLNSVVMALAGAGRIFELIDTEPEQDEGYVTLVNAKKENGEIIETKERTGIWAWKHPHHDGTTTYVELKGHIELEHVNFGYEPNKLVLHDVSLYAKPGQKIAFVGATGAGKTTITNLINRFYDINSGNIFYDGISIDRIKKDDLRHSLGIVLQDVNLYTGTIMDNIRYGNLLATDEECIKAAKLANADDFITRLPDGYQTVLTQNGASLSQGQRQLISIARAAVANPPVMILDEATSSIDTRTEALVQRGMDNLMKGRQYL